MADTTVDSATSTLVNTRNGLRGPYRINTLEGAMVFIDSNGDPSVRYTTDGGASRTKVVIEAQDTRRMAAYYDGEVPGDTGDKIHITWLHTGGAGAGICKYVDRDISSQTAGTIRSAATGLTVNEVSSVNNKLAITKTRNGNLLIGYICGASSEATIRSVDAGANWTGRTTLWESNSEYDHALFFPANTADTADACAIYRDISANAVSIKMYDDSANTRTETAIVSATDNGTYINMDGAIRHSDGHLLIAFYNAYDTATADLVTYDLTVNSIASPTITAKTNVFSNVSEAVQVAMIINQQNDDVYVGTLKGGTRETSANAVFYISTDDMATRGSEQAYSETTRDYRRAHGGRTISSAGGRIQFSVWDIDLFDIFVNLVNDIEISAVSAGTPSRLMLMGMGT